MVLTMEEIRDLALFCGFTVDGNGAETRDTEELETEYVIEDCPAQGVMDEDQKRALHYRHVAYIEEYPDEGVMGLGPELPNMAICVKTDRKDGQGERDDSE
jgi:hypothetical protein